MLSYGLYFVCSIDLREDYANLSLPKKAKFKR